MAEKKSFLLYTGYFEQIEMLNIEQRGILLTAIMAFQTDAKMPEMDSLTKMAFSFISSDMRRDNEKYEEIVERRKESGRKGGLSTQAKRASAKSASFASKTDFKQNQANQANQAVNVNVDVDVNDNEDVDVCVNDNEPEASKPKTHTIPTLDEVIQTAFQIGHVMSREEAQRFIDYNTALGWKLQWKYALVRWFDHIDEKQKEQENRWGNDPDQRKEYGGEIDWGC